MMWTFMLTGLACGSRLILYDGSPFHPDIKTYLKFISDQGWVIEHKSYSVISNNLPQGDPMGDKSTIFS